jgi:hypothetical protein
VAPYACFFFSPGVLPLTCSQEGHVHVRGPADGSALLAIGEFLTRYARDFGDAAPEPARQPPPGDKQPAAERSIVVLHTCFHWIELYEEFCSEWRRDRPGVAPPQYDWFVHVRKKHFGHLKLGHVTRQGKCGLCLNLSDVLRGLSPGEHFNALQEFKRRHLDLSLQERLCYADRKQLARTRPGEFASIAEDMSNGPGFPLHPQRAKDEAKVMVTTELIGLAHHGPVDEFELHFVRADAWKKNTDMVVSVLHAHLRRYLLDDSRPHARVLFVQLDNTTTENKNHMLLAFLSLLVELGYFERIIVSFLVVGHTHEDIDRFFGTAKAYMRRMHANSPPELFEGLERHLAKAGKKVTCFDCRDIWAYRPLLRDCLDILIQGITFPLCYNIARHGGASSPVTIKWREYSAVRLAEDPWKGSADSRHGFALLCPDAVANLVPPEPVAPVPLHPSTVQAIVNHGRIGAKEIEASPWWQSALAPPPPGLPPPWTLPDGLRQRLQAAPTPPDLPLPAELLDRLVISRRNWSRIIHLEQRLVAVKNKKKKAAAAGATAPATAPASEAEAAEPPAASLLEMSTEPTVFRRRRPGVPLNAGPPAELDLLDDNPFADDSLVHEPTEEDDDGAPARRRSTRRSGVPEQHIVGEYWTRTTATPQLWYRVSFGPPGSGNVFKMPADTAPPSLVDEWHHQQGLSQ